MADQQFTIVYVVNITHVNATFDIEVEDNALLVAPVNGVVEPGAQGVIRM